MDKWKKRALELITGLAFTGKKYPSVVPYVPSKLSYAREEKRYFHRSSPERHGICSSRLCKMIDELEAEMRANLHNIIVVKDGEVIAECSRAGYSVNVPHLSHSMSKSVTAMAIGFLVHDGLIKLDDKITSFFPEYTPRDKRFYALTVENLLNMTSGVHFAELGTVTESNWTKAFFEAKLDFEPGEMFAYNSMNTYILAHIVKRVSGDSLTHYLTEHLFAPLGIRNGFWEEGPEGVEKGGWGLYLSCESWAKIGVMMLSRGSFEGHRILPEEWVDEMLKTHSISPDKSGGYNYGYQIWVSRDSGEFLLNGMLGQNVWICPENNIVVSMNAENNELFQKSPALEIVERYLGGDISNDQKDIGMNFAILRKKEHDFYKSRCYANPKTPLKGLAYSLGLKNRRPFDEKWDDLIGKFNFAVNNQGVLPLFVRTLQNNYSGGIDSFEFKREGESLYLISTEDKKPYTIEIGLYGYKSNLVDFNGERYIINAVGEASADEKGGMIYKIEFVLPEMPNTRRIQIKTLENGEIAVKMSETPNHMIAAPFVESLYITNPKLAFAISLLERRMGDKLILRKFESMFTPTLYAVNTESSGYEDIMKEENSKIDEAMKTSKPISSLILKLLREKD